MQSVICTVFAASLLVAAAAPAQAAFQLVYDVLGVLDDGDFDNAGRATAVVCSNLTASAVNVRVRAFLWSGAPVGKAVTTSIPGGGTRAFSTHQTDTHSGLSTSMETGGLSTARIRVLAEVPSAIVCDADYLDASAFPPSFVIPRKMIRHPRGSSGGEE